MKKPLIIHPFIFVLLPILVSPVARESLPEAVLLPLLGMELAMVAVYFLLKLLLKDDLKAGISASMLIPYTFCFAAFQTGVNTAVQSICGKDAEDALLLIAYTYCWGIGAFIMWRGYFQFGKLKLELDFTRFTTALNVVSVFLLITNGVPTLLYHVNASAQHAEMVAHFKAQDSQYPIGKDVQEKPDIYYLILDCNASHSTLQMLWNYDNSAFIKSLQDKGFCVVDQAFSNYARTVLSIPSSLNMQYIDPITDKHGKDFHDDTLNYRLMQDSRVSRLLKSLGYKYINIFSGFQPTEYVPTADLNFIKSPGSNHLLQFMQLSVLSGIEKYFPFILDVYAETRLAPYKYASEIAAIPGPKFVFIHSLISHPPNVFDAKGHKNPLSRALLNEHSIDGYVEQIKYTETQVESFVQTLLNRPGPKPIIIIHSDHGPMFRTPESKTYYNENMRILLAYYFPKDKNCLHRLSPVNIFRLMFNTEFGAKLPLLPERAYCNLDLEPKVQYHYQDVTDQLVFPPLPERADIK